MGYDCREKILTQKKTNQILRRKNDRDKNGKTTGTDKSALKVYIKSSQDICKTVRKKMFGRNVFFKTRKEGK